MKKYLKILSECPLFSGMNADDIQKMLECLKKKEKSYKKDEFIYRAGDKPGYIGIVLSGTALIVQEDYWGNRMILTTIEPGNLFAEAFSCARAQTIPVSVIARGQTDVIMLDYEKIIGVCTCACEYHTRLINNMLSILAKKNMTLTRKMEHITKKTIKEKALSYLSQQAALAGSKTFKIPYNRQELAEYLSVDRSALSAVLGVMRDEGLIEFKKNIFTLI